METKIIKGDLIKDKIFGEVKKETARLKDGFKEAPDGRL